MKNVYVVYRFRQILVDVRSILIYIVNCSALRIMAGSFLEYTGLWDACRNNGMYDVEYTNFIS